MCLGLAIFTLFHVALSLVGIAAGLVVVLGWINAKWRNGWNAWFLISTIATTVTGFLFPIHKFTPALGIGIVSSILLAVAVFALYRRQLAGGWRRAYVLTAVIALYFNTFLFVVQLFEKIPALKELAPTQSESPFKVAQLVTLAIFIVLGTLATKGFTSKHVSTA